MRISHPATIAIILFLELISTVVLILTVLTFEAGSSAIHLQSDSILTLDITGLKSAYQSNTGEVLPIHDVYNLYLTTYCAGNYHDGATAPLVDVTCSKPSSNFKFLPANIIAQELGASHSNATISSLNFPMEIENNFSGHFNLQFHVAFIFYILSVVALGGTLLSGLVAFALSPLIVLALIWSSFGNTFIFIASVITTAVQAQAAGLINDYGSDIGVLATSGSGILGLTWAAFAINGFATILWAVLGAIGVGIDIGQL